MVINISELSLDDLKCYKQKIEEELLKREPKNTHRYSIKWHSYNFRAYGKPWIANIKKWDVGQKPELVWGSFIGNGNSGGELEITASAGDIIRYGQRDLRKPHRSINRWSVADEDGDVYDITETEARKLFNAKK